MKAKPNLPKNNRKCKVDPAYSTTDNHCNSSPKKPVKLTSLQYVSPLGSGNEKKLKGSNLKGVQKKKKRSKENKRGKFGLASKLLEAINLINKDVPFRIDESSQNDDCIIEVFNAREQRQSSNEGVSNSPQVSATITTQNANSVMENPVCVGDHNQSSEEVMITGQSKHVKSIQQDIEILNVSKSSVIIIEDSSMNSMPKAHIPGNTDSEKSQEEKQLTCENTEGECNQSVLIIDEDSNANATLKDNSNFADNVNSGYNSTSQQEKPCVDNTKRKGSETDAANAINNSAKKRQSSPSIDDTPTGSLLTETGNKETRNPEDNASPVGSSENLNKAFATVDLDPDIISDSNSCSSLNNTICLSDEESTNDDIVVLGTPVVPSVRSYKTVSRKQKREKVAPLKSHLCESPLMSYVKRPPIMYQANVPSVDLTSNVGTNVNATQDIIARALSELSTLTRQAAHLHNSTSVLQLPSAGPASVTESNTRPSQLSSPVSIYGSNIYNPCGTTVRTGLRPVIIDGSNVAMSHGNGNFFSTKGLQICINYFVKRGHKVFAFVPQFRRHNTFTRDSHLLEDLHKEKLVIFTPSRVVDGHSDVPYDDRYIVQTAAELGGVIVSTDNFRDLLQENVQWHDTIKNRLLMFTWVEDILIFPQDPLGRRGKKLDEFLQF